MNIDTTDQAPVLEPGHTYASVNQSISEFPLTKLKRTPMGWIGGFLVAFLIVMGFLLAVGNLFLRVWVSGGIISLSGGPSISPTSSGGSGSGMPER